MGEPNIIGGKITRGVSEGQDLHMERQGLNWDSQHGFMHGKLNLVNLITFFEEVTGRGLTGAG